MIELKDVNNAGKQFLLCFKTDNKRFYNLIKKTCLECMASEEMQTEPAKAEKAKTE